MTIEGVFDANNFKLARYAEGGIGASGSTTDEDDEEEVDLAATFSAAVFNTVEASPAVFDEIEDAVDEARVELVSALEGTAFSSVNRFLRGSVSAPFFSASAALKL